MLMDSICAPMQLCVKMKAGEWRSYKKVMEGEFEQSKKRQCLELEQPVGMLQDLGGGESKTCGQVNACKKSMVFASVRQPALSSQDPAPGFKVLNFQECLAQAQQKLKRAKMWCATEAEACQGGVSSVGEGPPVV